MKPWLPLPSWRELTLAAALGLMTAATLHFGVLT